MTSEKLPLNVAIIGCGGYAGYLIDRLEEVADTCRLVAVATRDPDSDTAQKIRAKGIAVYGNVDEMLRMLSPDECPAVIVPTSIDSHIGYAQKIVTQGFHVLLEKPPVAVIQDLEKLIELQNSSGKFIAVNFQYLFNPMTQSLKRRLQAGEFGAVRSVRARAVWCRPEAYFTRSCWCGKLQIDGRWVLDGTIGNPLAHLLAEALYLASTEPGMARPVRIKSELYHANAIDSEDTSCLRIKTANGATVFYCSSLCSNNTDSSNEPVFCDIHTERAVIELIDYYKVKITWNDGRVEEAETPGNNKHQDRQIMLKSLAQSLVKNEKPIITVEECRSYVTSWNGAFESFGAPVCLPKEAVDLFGSASRTVRCIRGIEELVQQACREEKLFFELGVNWACSGVEVDLTEYNRFPSNCETFIDMTEGETVSILR